MKKKPHDTFNTSDIEHSAIIHEFLSLFREFHESMSRNSAEKVLLFLQDDSKRREFVEHARFNPHPETHQDVENDIDATVTSLRSWINDKVESDVPGEFLHDLRSWVINE